MLLKTRNYDKSKSGAVSKYRYSFAGTYHISRSMTRDRRTRSSSHKHIHFSFTTKSFISYSTARHRKLQ